MILLTERNDIGKLGRELLNNGYIKVGELSYVRGFNKRFHYPRYHILLWTKGYGKDDKVRVKIHIDWVKALHHQSQFEDRVTVRTSTDYGIRIINELKRIAGAVDGIFVK